MNILVKVADLLSIYALGILCAVFCLASGILLLVTKNTNLISKKGVYNNPNEFCLLYGLIEAIGSLIILVLMVVSIFIQELYMTFFIIVGIIAIGMFISLFLVNKNYKRK